VIPSDLSFGYLSAELKSPVKIPIPNALEVSSPEGTESSCDFDQTPPEDWDIDTQSAEHATETTQSSS